MAVDLKIKSNEKEIIKKFQRLQSKLPRFIDKGVKQAGFQLVDIIRTKTKRGVDFRDVGFEPYSESYRKQLEREGKPTSVDLFYTGRMLGSLTSTKTGKHKVSLGFTNAQMRQRALFNQVLNQPNREFFGFNDRTEKIISNQFNKFVKKEFERAL